MIAFSDQKGIKEVFYSRKISMKKLFLYWSLSLLMILMMGCWEAQTTTNEMPEVSPTCPEGRYWIDSIKSCEMIVDDFSQ